jgi:hypothetical protein
MHKPLRFLKTLPAICTVVLAALALPSQAITFTEPESAPWVWVQDVPEGCVARLETHNKIYVGACLNRVPHGRGLYFADQKLLAARANNGKVYKTTAYTVSDTDLDIYAQKADYLAAFHAIFLLADNFQYTLSGPKDSAVYQAVTRFVTQYNDVAQNDDMTQARQKQETAQLNGFARAYTTVNNQRESGLAARMLQEWQGHLTPAQTAQVQALQTTFAKQEQMERDRRAQEAAAYATRLAQDEQQRLAYRQSRIKTACNGFYPGYVARYNRGGLLGTADKYVVRYLNAGRSTVTIEGTDSGNSLAYGQVVELSCIDLLERTE